MRPPHTAYVIIAALNLAHDYIYYLTLHIHSNDCAILTPSHETQIYLQIDPITPALPRPKEHPQKTRGNATRRTSRPYRWARQRARDTVSD
jgi:hypothetical protein